METARIINGAQSHTTCIDWQFETEIMLSWTSEKPRICSGIKYKKGKFHNLIHKTHGHPVKTQ